LLQGLAAQASRHRYQRGQVIFNEGQPGIHLLVLVSGALKLTVTSPVGGELILTVLSRPGDVAGEVSLLDGSSYEASCEVLQDSEVLVVARESFLSPLKASAEVAEALCLAMAARLRQSIQQSSDLALLDVQGRLAKVLLGLAERQDQGPLPFPLTQDDLARMVGTSRVSVNRILRLWRDRGFLSLDRYHITVREPDVLERLATSYVS
jgi:CRP-like cAMP-binding protein